MKKILVMFALGIVVSGAAYAQEAPKKDRKHKTEYHGKKEGKQAQKSPEERASLRTEKMSKQLGLNKSQVAKLHALNLRQAQEMQAMHASNATPVERGQKRGEERKANRAKWESELKTILTQKQYAQYEAERPQMRERASDEQNRGKDSRKRKEAKIQQSS